MEKQSTEKGNLDRLNKPAFWLIIFPLIFTTLLIVILALIIFTNGGKKPAILENWANISVILISLVLFLPGVIFLAFIIAMNYFLGKIRPVVEQGLTKTKLFSTNFTNLVLAFIRMALYPFSIAKVLTLNKKIEYPLDKESVNE